MTEPENSATESGQPPVAAPTETTTPVGRTNRRRRAIVALAAAGLVIAALQWIARDFDHQYANMISITLGLIVVMYVVFQAHQASRGAGRPWLVPACTSGFLIGFNVLFQFDGVSGELVPHFRYRFSQTPALKVVQEQNNQEQPEAESDHSIAAANSPGFLGPHRNGVIPERLFSIPTNPDEVKVLWDQGIGQGWGSFAVSADRAVTLEQRDDQECVTCYRLSDGKLLWMQSHQASHYHVLGGAGPRSTPTIVGDVVFAQGSTGRVWCLDLQSGEPKWTVDLLKLGGWDQEDSEVAVTWGRAGSPLVVGDLCVVPFGSPVDPNKSDPGQRSLIALSTATGEVRWKAGSDQISYASPMLMNLAGQMQIVSVNEMTVTGHRVDDGSVLWSYEWHGHSDSDANCSAPMQAGPERFLVGKGYSGGSALVHVTKTASDGFQADEVWTSLRVLETKFTHACVDGKIAYALSDGSLQAVDIEDQGRRLWLQPRGSRFGQGQILLVDDVIIGQDESGDIVFVAADPKEYRELLRLSALNSKTWNIPTIAGRHLLVRNDRQAICYLLPPQD